MLKSVNRLHLKNNSLRYIGAKLERRSLLEAYLNLEHSCVVPWDTDRVLLSRSRRRNSQSNNFQSEVRPWKPSKLKSYVSLWSIACNEQLDRFINNNNLSQVLSQHNSAQKTCNSKETVITTFKNFLLNSMKFVSFENFIHMFFVGCQSKTFRAATSNYYFILVRVHLTALIQLVGEERL